MNKLLVILSLILAFSALCQKPEVSLSIEPKQAEIGEIFTITVRSNVQGQVEIDNKPSSYVPGYDVMNGMEQDMDHNTGIVTTYYYISETGAIGKAGKYTIGPAFVTQGNKVYKSNTVEITIADKTQMTNGKVTSAQLKQDAFGIVQTNKKTVYEGEPILVSAKVYSHFDPTHLAGYRSYSMKGAIDKQPVGNSQRILVEKEIFKGINFYAFEYDKNIIFPAGTGIFKISGYAMNLHRGYESFPITSNHATVEILPLPENPPTDFIGAVGNFTVHRSIDSKEMKQGDVFKMNITIEGYGNLQNTIEPTPVLPKGLIVYGDPIIEEHFVYSSKGTEGIISYDYNIQVNIAGEIELPATTISYFDVNQEKYITASSELEQIRVKADKSFIVEEVKDPKSSAIEELSYTAELRPSLSKAKERVFFNSPVFWASVGTPLFAALIFLFIKRQRESSADEIVKREISRQKDKDLSDSLAKINLLLNGSDDYAFHNEIEFALIKAFEIILDIDEDLKLSKQDIYTYLENSGQSELSIRVKTLLSTADQFRYGFQANTNSKQKLSEELNSILANLK
ncbi:MAG: BatD family protein [Crocinitomicaceae bacterium]|nr:BatD family protein [Crocinitomicaceae bacterium]